MKKQNTILLLLFTFLFQVTFSQGLPKQLNSIFIHMDVAKLQPNNFGKLTASHSLYNKTPHLTRNTIYNDKEEAKKSKVYTKKQVYKFTGLSLLANLTTLTGIGTMDSTAMTDLNIPWWLYAAMGSHHLPLYALDTKKALSYTIPDAVFLASHVATRKEQRTFSYVPLHLYINDQFFSTYDIYKTTREGTKPGVYPEDWKSYTRKELLVAPFKFEVLKKPIVWVPLTLAAGVTVAFAIKNQDAVWNTGTSYIDGKEVPIAASVPLIAVSNAVRFDATAVGEEALYRGVLYEEYKLKWGPKKAKIIDMLVFPAIHVPGDIVKGSTFEEAADKFIFRSLSTLLFDFAYDKGGLPASTALHFWFNNVSSTINWLSNGGSPPPLTIAFSRKF